MAVLQNEIFVKSRPQDFQLCALSNFRLHSFGIIRVQLSVSGGQVACVEYDNSGDVKASWRLGLAGQSSGRWTESSLSERRSDSVFVATSVRANAEYTMEVKEVTEDKCEKGAPGGGLDPIDCLLE